jgi:hypothetical protein
MDYLKSIRQLFVILTISLLIIFFFGCNQTETEKPEPTNEFESNHIIEDSQSNNTLTEEEPEPVIEEASSEPLVGTVPWVGGTYTGALLEGKPNGEGSWVNQNGDIYNGNWSNGKNHGQGYYTWANGDEIEGTWEEGTLVFATIINQSAITDNYAGETVDGKPHGFGVFYLRNYYNLIDEVYIGEWRKGKKHGCGIHIINNIDQYHEYFDSINFILDGDIYKGNWVDDQRSGQGTLTFMDGACYTGNWANDMPHGNGTFTLPDRFELNGNWVFGKLFDAEIFKEKSLLSETRKYELEKIKDKDIYQDPIINKLGQTKLDIIKEYGIPSSSFSAGQGYSYEKAEISFIFSPTEEIVTNIFLSGYKFVLGIILGEMTFSQIEDILGEAYYKNHGYLASDGDYSGSRMSIYLGDYHNNQGELNLDISSDSDDKHNARANWMLVTWCRYYW